MVRWRRHECLAVVLLRVIRFLVVWAGLERVVAVVLAPGVGGLVRGGVESVRKQSMTTGSGNASMTVRGLPRLLAVKRGIKGKAAAGDGTARAR